MQLVFILVQMSILTLPETMTRQQFRRLFKRKGNFGVMRQIAKDAEVSVSSVTLWLKGKRQHSPAVEEACRRKAAELLGVTTDRMAEIEQKTSAFHPKD